MSDHSTMRPGDAHDNQERSKRVTGNMNAPYQLTPAPTEESDNFLPAFYDSLPTICLTTRALREFDRRDREQQRQQRQQLLENADYPEPPVEEENQEQYMPGDILPFPVPAQPHHLVSASSVSEASSESRRSSAYDGNFKMQLIKCSIFPVYFNYRGTDELPPQPVIWELVYNKLNVYRRSVSPSALPESEFTTFRVQSGSPSESTIMQLLSAVQQTSSGIRSESSILFTNVLSITNGIGVALKPDFFDGAPLATLHPKVRDTLDRYIIPSTHHPAIVAPNFFLEVKTSDGTPSVAELQSIHNGAYGAMMMQKLRIYGNGKDVFSVDDDYDNSAYAFSATFVGSILTLYTHHLAAPDTPNGRPMTFTNVLDAYAMAGSPTKWREGIRALRNLREHAKEVRDSLIAAANAHARKLDMAEASVSSASPRALGPTPFVETRQDSVQTPTTAQKEKAPARTPARVPANRAIPFEDDRTEDGRSSSSGVFARRSSRLKSKVPRK